MARCTSLLAVVLALLIAASHVHATAPATAPVGAVLDVPLLRGLMYDRRLTSSKINNYGTRATLLRGPMVLYTDDVSSRGVQQQQRYKGRTPYVPCDTHLEPAQLRQLLELPVRGLVLELCEADTHNEQAVASHFAAAATGVPVYFLQDPAAAAQLRRTLQRVASTSSDEVRIAVGVSEKELRPVLNATLPAYTIVSQMHYRLREFRRTARQQPAPRVLITANVDTMGVAPAQHTVSGASGAVAAMELWRRVVATAARPAANETEHTQSPYGVTLLLGSTARVNFVGTSTWLAAQKDAELETYTMAISLDELLPLPQEQQQQFAGHRGGSSAGAAQTLYMHVPTTFERAADGKHVEQLALAAAKATGITLQLVATRTDFHHYDLRFEHEVFANRQFAAASFSAYKTHHRDQIFRDVSRPLTEADVAVLCQRIDFLQLFLQSLLNITAEPMRGADEQAQSRPATVWTGAATYVDGLLRHAARTPRSLIARSGSEGNSSLESYMAAVEQHMRQHNSLTRGTLATAASALHADNVVPNTVRFYAPYEERLHVYIAKTTWTELGVMLLIACAIGGFALLELGRDGVKALVHA